MTVDNRRLMVIFLKTENYKKMIFVVGNSRSGTTMMGRILGETSKCLHFWGTPLFRAVMRAAFFIRGQ